MRVTLQLNTSDIGRFKHKEVGPRGECVPLVRLSTSKAATIKAGKALVCTIVTKIAKHDWHALVPYSTDSSLAAEKCDVMVKAATAVAELAEKESSQCKEAAVNTLDAAAYQARAVMRDAGRHAREADLSGGFNAGCAALLANLQSIITAGEAIMRAARAHMAAIQGHFCACRQRAEILPGPCQQPANPAPSSICTVLEIERLVKWE
jgi:hypothetical protein